MHDITDNEYEKIKIFLTKKAHLLRQIENKSFTKIGFDKSCYKSLKINNRKFIVISTNVFHHVITDVLPAATKNFSTGFGKNDANKVLKSLYNEEIFGAFVDFKDFLKLEQFAWIIEIINNEVSPKILRIDLFNDIKTDREDNSKTEFIGGLMHVFKHFAYNDIPLSTKSENHQIENPKDIFEILIKGFFITDLVKENDINYHSKLFLENKKHYLFIFRYKTQEKVYFIKTIIYKRR